MSGLQPSLSSMLAQPSVAKKCGEVPPGTQSLAGVKLGYEPAISSYTPFVHPYLWCFGSYTVYTIDLVANPRNRTFLCSDTVCEAGSSPKDLGVEILPMNQSMGWMTMTFYRPPSIL